ncbi:paraquat-inducible protein A [bacterium]|nr:paraquat-inducible protein A [bacterium]
MRFRPRDIIGLVLVAASYVAFVPGITKPLITLSASVKFLGNEMELFRETRSMLRMIDSLHDSGNDFVAGLILLFGIVIPVAKGLLILAGAFLPGRARRGADLFARSITKWAMNDVFVVAVYVAFLSAKATDALDATLEPGFFWFTGYVLLSLASLAFLRPVARPVATPDPPPAAGDPTPSA